VKDVKMDDFKNFADSAAGPSRKPFLIVPHDVNPLPDIPKRLFVGSGGDIILRGVDGTADVPYKNLGDGVYVYVSPQYIRATGTTAANIIGEA
jgi:hypothetical protein